MAALNLKDYVRDVPDFPKPGILYRDITPLLHDHFAFSLVVDMLAERYADSGCDVIGGIESRGFVFAAPLAYKLGIALVPIRKLGNLPYRTHTMHYDLEYGSDAVEVHVDAIESNDRVLIVDDLLATGGTMGACAKLVERAGGEVAGLAVVIELTDLGGRKTLSGYDVQALVQY